MKKNFKSKGIAILIMLVMIFATVSAVLPAYAASTTVKVSDVTALPGEQVSVDVSISGNTGFGSGKFTIEYDSNVLTLTKLDTKGKLLAGGAPNVAKGKISFAKATDVTDDGVLFTAIFDVNADAPNGVYVISVKVEDMTSAETHEPVTLTTKKGSVKIHKCGDAKYIEEVPATCTKAGTKAHYACSCGKLYSDKDCTKEVTASSLNISKKSHTYGEWIVTKEPTCTAKGQRKHTCTVCNTTTSGTISAKGHNWGEWVVTTPATATENGVETKTCSECNAKETREILAIGHTFGEWVETKAPTCTEKGEQTRTCTDEGCDAKETREVAALGHSYGDWTQTKAPTCTEVGEESRTCANCKGVEKRDVAKDADNHSFGEWTVTTAPTCGVKGVETRTCACGAKETREVTEITHEWEWVVDKEATKTKDGSKHEECKHCGETRNEGTVIEKTGNGMLVFWIILIIIIVLGIVVVVIAFIYKRKKTSAK